MRGRIAAYAFGTAAVAALVLGGCGAQPDGGPSRAPSTSQAAEPAVPDPTGIVIPKIGARSALTKLGLGPDRELEVPPVTDPMTAGWYAGAKRAVDGDEYAPGERGPAVIAGHVDGVVNGKKGQPGIFFRLHELVPGDEILIEREAAPVLRFVVTGVQRYAKDAFPSEAVYGPTEGPELRLITCGGPFDRSSGHYVENVIVFADLA